MRPFIEDGELIWCRYELGSNPIEVPDPKIFCLQDEKVRELIFPEKSFGPAELKGFSYHFEFLANVAAIACGDPRSFGARHSNIVANLHQILGGSCNQRSVGLFWLLHIIKAYDLKKTLLKADEKKTWASKRDGLLSCFYGDDKDNPVNIPIIPLIYICFPNVFKGDQLRVIQSAIRKNGAWAI